MDDLDRLPRFVDRWYARPLRPRHGSSEGELRAVERRIERPLPPALRRLYRRIGRRISQWDCQDHLLRPESLPEFLVRDARGRPETIVFLIENQGVWLAGVPARGARDGKRTSIRFRWDDVSLCTRRSLPAFLLDVVVRETVLGGILGPLARGVRRGTLADWFDRIPRWSRDLPRIAGEDLVIPLPPGLGDERRLRIEVRGSDDLLVIENQWVLARNAATWDEVVDLARTRCVDLKPWPMRSR